MDVLEKGALVVSLDTELAWGRLDHPDLQRYLPFFEKTHEVVKRLLEVFERRGTPATWALVGRMTDPGPAPAGIPRPAWDGSPILEAILRSPIGHEIASHGFSHALFDAIPREAAEAELEASVKAASRWGLTLRSLVFPRNRVGHLDLLPKYGLICYRAPDQNWHGRFPETFRRVFRQFDAIFAVSPQATRPERVGERLVRIDGHLPFFVPSFGFKSRLPASLWVRRAEKGLAAARRGRAVFHLWLHPHDFVHRREEQLGALDAILKRAAKLRDEGRLAVATMGEVAAAVLDSSAAAESAGARTGAARGAA